MNWKKLERHPLSAQYPDITGEAWKDFVANLKEHGPGDRHVTLHEGKVLDGWQLQRACLELNVEPRYQPLREGLDPVAFVETANDMRRHESAEVQEHRRTKRRARVAAARQSGQSLRAIAESEEVSEYTVRSDLKAATAMGIAVEPESGQVTGQDGKKRKAKVRLLCNRCNRAARVGQKPTKGCPACADLNRKGRTRKKAEPSTNGTPTKDAFGNDIPQRRLDAWGDPWLTEAHEVLAVALDKVLTARLAEGMKKRAKHYPFIVAADVIDALGFATNYLDQAIEHLKACRPAGVCPACAGKGCPECKQCGLVPRSVYEELKAKVPA